MNTAKRFVLSVFLLIIPFQILQANPKEVSTLPVIWNVPQTSKNVISRGDFINKMRLTFSNTPKNQTGTFYLSGPTGIGKTYIAKTYANNYRKNYDIVYIFNGKATIIEQLKKFNYELNQLEKKLLVKNLEWNNSEPDKIIHYSKEFLRTTKLKWLIVFDNIDKDSNISEFIPEHTLSSAGHIIFTSQAHQVEQNAIPAPLPSIEASRAFLTKEFQDRNDKKENILLLARELKNYPIALSQAAAYLKKNTTISIDEYLKILSVEEDQNPLKVSEKAVLTSVNDIQKADQKSKKLINMISCMHSKNIPGSLLKNWFINQEKGSYQDFTTAIDLAISYSLITPTRANSDFFETHDFIQETIYNTLTSSERIELNKSLISSIRTEFMKESKDIINPIFSEIIDHAKAAYERGRNEENISDEFLSLLIDILEHNNTYKRDFAANYAYIMQIAPIFKSSQIRNVEIKSRFYVTAARFFWRLGKMKECENYLAEADKTISSSNIEEYNRLKIYQSDLQIELSNLDKAKNYLDELERYSTKNGYAKKPGSSAHYYLMVLHHMSLADFFNLSGDFDKALYHINFGIQKATDYYKAKTGAEAPLSVMAPLYNTRNFSLIMKNDPSVSSKDMLELAKQMAKTFNSNEHRFVSLAKILHSKTIMPEHPVEAMDVLQTSVKDLDQWFQGANINKDQVLAHLLLGNLYSKTNDLDKSINHLTNALDISKTIFKDLRNTYVHETMDGLVAAYLKKDSVFEAQNIYNMHKEIFTESDPRTKSVYDKILAHYHVKEKS
jgi:hypothetical protein